MSNLSTGTRITDVTADNTTYITAATWVPENNADFTPTSATIASDIFTLAGNGLANGDILQIKSVGTITGTGITLGNLVYVVNVSGNNFGISLTFGGTAIDLTGANTTPCTFNKVQDYTLSRQSGFISVTTSGTYRVLPESHFDTDSTTVSSMGARDVYIVAGVPYPVLIKKVFSTGSAATTGIVCIFN